eukprot:TRINITY_DN91471_c0_g1_i1.p1 TRINITY_DN91471_c0_g1~~TRINITY_DN91471_c0_g1_i1.p1  ORF type:complete len:225 (+),score=57.14 TRINITY_DN91471_c0_g1_i1:89-763(+)
MASQVLIVGRGNLGEALHERLTARGGVGIRIASRSSDDVKLDLSSRESVLALDTQLEAASVDHVVVCCGTSTFGPLSSFNAETWQANVSGKLLAVSQFVLALIHELKILKDGASITITTGQAATTINKLWPGIACNNAGLNAFVANGGLDLPRGLRLNAMSPCLVMETALKAGLPTDGAVPAADCALVYEELIFGTETAVVKTAGVQVAFKRKDEGLAKTSDMA